MDSTAPGRPSTKAATAAWPDMPSTCGGLPDLEEPILADFLTGHSDAALPGHLAEPQATVARLPAGNPQPDPAAGKVAESSTQVAQEEERPARERRFVVAALQPSEALSKALAKSPPRPAVANAVHRSPEPLPELFSVGFGEYMEQCRGTSAGAETARLAAERRACSTELEEKTQVAASARLRKPRLRVLDWHRLAVQKMLCRTLLVKFLQDQRKALGLPAGQSPLWSWEVREAQEHSEAGHVTVLVKYLAETELHTKLGPQRSIHHPGSQLLERVAQRLRAERKQLVQKWGVADLALEEDAVLRVFLDGHLSWPRVRDLLMGPKVPSARRA